MKNMKNLFISIVLLALTITSLDATSVKFNKEMNYETDYKKALVKAKKENKMLMIVFSQTTCPWCRKFERQTLKKNNIDTLIKEDFIPLSLDKDIKNYPKIYETKVVPTIFFVNAKNETIIKKVLGYKNKKDFYTILEKVNKK